MEITVGAVQSAKSNLAALNVMPAARSGRTRDRRKKERDRRENAREGIIVSLTARNDRRKNRDRRRLSDPFLDFEI